MADLELRKLVQRFGAAHRGDLVLVRTPRSVRQLAAERGYLPQTVPLVKRVAALDGDIVRAAGDVISVNDRVVAERLARDRLGRPMPNWSGCRLLDGGEVFDHAAGRQHRARRLALDVLTQRRRHVGAGDQRQRQEPSEIEAGVKL